jgi:DNA-binding SARP family transcriptional activator
MEFCLLGPLVVRRDGVVVEVPAGKQRAVLAALLLSAGRVVAVGDLAETVWGDNPPTSARVTLQNYVKRLRHALGDADRTLIITRPQGYQISVTRDDLDVGRFEALQCGAREAVRHGDWQGAADQLRAALSLWRGEPLADTGSELLMLRQAPRLAEMRAQAVEACIDADLRLGRHREAITELRQLAAAYPLRERLHAQLMLALYRCGRQAEALAAYRQARRTIVAELGVEPGPELRELHERMLAADPGLMTVGLAPAAAAAADGAPPGNAGHVGANAPGQRPPRQPLVVPRQLPPPVRHFVGRAGELKALAGLLEQAAGASARDSTGGMVVISAIGGTAGVGKTALAVHFAHQVAERFRDGQLYVNLRGFDPSGTPLTPADAVRGFLGALGVPLEHVPASPDAQAALYRSLLSGRQMLILLDNARDAAQVRPLLPGSPGCLVLVTGRSKLVGLVAAESAHPIMLDVLSDVESADLLARRIGAERVAREPAAAAELTGLCARLPLALALTAARAAAHLGFPLAALAAELRDARQRLDVLETGEPAGDVRAVFSWSYQHLTAPAARMFRLLGVHPGPGITVPVAASLAAAPAGAVRRELGELTAAGLLSEHAPGRYAFHDLLRAYAAEQAAEQDDDSLRRAAIGRMLDHYLHTAYAAALLANPTREPIALGAPQPGAAPEHLAGDGEALAWFQAEHQVLLAAIELAAASGFDAHAWQISWCLAYFLDTRGDWHNLAITQSTALAAGRRLGDKGAQASAHTFLGRARRRIGCYDDARSSFQRALRLFRQVGDHVGQAGTHQDMAQLYAQQGHYRDALGHVTQALDLYRAAGRRSGGQAEALNNAGWCHAQLGDHDQALGCCQQALELNRAFGDKPGEAATLDSLGYAHHHLGHHNEAIACYRHSIGLLREVGNPWGEAIVLTHLGDSHHALGDTGGARGTWKQALAILDGLHHPDAAEVRAKLRELDAAAIAR